MKKNPGRKERRRIARANRRAEGRIRARAAVPGRKRGRPRKEEQTDDNNDK